MSSSLLRSCRQRAEGVFVASIDAWTHMYYKRMIPFKRYVVTGWESGTLWLFCNGRYHFQGKLGRHALPGILDDKWAIVEGALRVFDHYLCPSDDGACYASYKTRLVLEKSTWATVLPGCCPGMYAFALSAFEARKLNSRMDEFLKALPSGGEVAELGVDTGAFGKAILEINQPTRLHLVDIWDSVPDPYPSLERAQENFRNVQGMFASPMADGRVLMHKGDDLEYLSRFPDHHFDWIYIDTTHYYRQTLRELELAARKVKQDGYICGHDFWDSTFSRRCRFAVMDAVRSFVRHHSWEFAFLTEDEPPSFALRRSSQ